MPKSTHDGGNGNWSFDPDSLGAVLPALPGAYNGSVGTGATASRGVPAVSAPPTQQQQSGKSGGPEAGSGTGPGSEMASTTASASAPAPARPTTAQKLRVRRSTFVPGWAVPPRVLLVDDDEVNRRMSSKFLQVFGCTIDVAVDGVGAVERMNLEKCDLVPIVR